MSYGDLAGANTYHADRGNSAWTGTDTVKSQALIRAQDYIRTSYVARFAAGFDATATDVDSATYEAALMELVTPGVFSKTYTEAETKVLVGLGDLRWQVTGSTKDARSFAPRSSKIEALLWPYMARTYGAVTV
jgi:hypothetical protein